MRARLMFGRWGTRNWSRRLPAASARAVIAKSFCLGMEALSDTGAYLSQAGLHVTCRWDPKDYRATWTGTLFGTLLRRYQMSDPVMTRQIEINCVPVMRPPKTEPRPGSSRMNSRK